MNTVSILMQCVDQAEQLKSRIRNNSNVSDRCLGGTMKPTYEKIRAHQLDMVQKILRKIQLYSKLKH